MSQTIPDVPEDQKIRGWKWIAIELHVDRKTARKFGTREKHRLPVWHDHTGDWMEKTALAAWIESERKSYVDYVREQAEQKAQTPLAS